MVAELSTGDDQLWRCAGCCVAGVAGSPPGAQHRTPADRRRGGSRSRRCCGHRPMIQSCTVLLLLLLFLLLLLIKLTVSHMACATGGQGLLTLRFS